MGVKGFCCLKLGQGFKTSVAHLFPNIGRVPPHPGVPNVSRHANDDKTTMLNYFFVNFARKKNLVRSRGRRFCFCPLYILPLPQIMKKLCWCPSNIIFEDVWHYVFAPLGETQCWGDCSCLGPKGEIKTCFNGLMGHVDLKKLHIALSLVKPGWPEEENVLITIMDKSLGKRQLRSIIFWKWHIPSPFPHSTNNVGRVFPEFFPSFSFVLGAGRETAKYFPVGSTVSVRVPINYR